jgi:predicted dehydrogenase
MSRPLRISRRAFLRSTATGAAGLTLAGCQASPTPRRVSANEKLNLGAIGVAGRGGEDLKAVSSQNIVALCDVDSQRLEAAARLHPQAAKYADFRQLLDRNDLDGVVIGTPDHTHAVIAVAALKSGRHVYCEKPLTHTISEARRVADVARQSGRVTQMGNQIHSGTNYRRVVEIVQSGALGDVREVHHWVDGAWDVRKRPEPDPIPPHLDWELWLGPVPYRDYSDQYAPFNWRRWWAFGGGTLADFRCHHIDLGVWALQLGLPTRIEAEGPPVDVECAPPWLIVHYDFPARRAPAQGGRGPTELPPVRLTWYHGGRRPPQFADGRLPKWGNGSLFVGSKGMLLADYDKYRLFPEEAFRGFQPPAPWIPNSPGQHEEWIRAIKGGPPTLCHFGYGAQLTEIGLLGNVSYRAGQPLEWNAAVMKATNCPAAETFIRHEYRRGWRL